MNEDLEKLAESEKEFIEEIEAIAEMEKEGLENEICLPENQSLEKKNNGSETQGKKLRRKRKVYNPND